MDYLIYGVRRYALATIMLVILSICLGFGPLTKMVYADDSDTDLDVWWKFDEGLGTTANDSSVNNHDGTLYNGPTYVAGHEGTAMSFNGIDQYVQNDIPLDSFGTADVPYALSAWVKIASETSYGNIIHVSSEANGGSWCIPFLRLEDGYFVATSWDGNQVSATAQSPAVADQWYQLLTTWDATNGLRLYVDGVLQQATPQSHYEASGVPMYISPGLSNYACSENQGFFEGEIDDVRVYKRVITSTDVSEISNNPTSYTVVNQPASTTVTLVSDANTNVVNTGQTGVKAVNVSNATYKIASFDVDFAANRDWTSLTTGSDGTKAFFHYPGGFSSLPGHSGSGFTLYIPDKGGNRVRICPGAAGWGDVGSGCSGEYFLTTSNVSVSKETESGKAYWVVSGLTGTGGEDGGTESTSNGAPLFEHGTLYLTLGLVMLGSVKMLKLKDV